MDIKRLGWFAINPIRNNIYVNEFIGVNKWIYIFSTNGKYLGEWKCELNWEKYKALSIIKFDQKGTVYIQTEKDLDNWETGVKSVRWIKRGMAEGWFDLKYWRKNLPFPGYKPVSGSHLFIESQGYLYIKKYSEYNSSHDIRAKIDLSNDEVSSVNSISKE